MTSIKNIIRARKVVQNNQEFLLGTFQIRQVKNFTRYTQHLIVGYEDVEEKVYEDQKQIIPITNNQIQRKLNNSKVEGIADFLINDPTAMFPTNIVVAIPNQVIDDFEEEENELIKITLNKIVQDEIKKADGNVYLTIIDGQHRIRGIERAIEKVSTEIGTITKILANSSKGNKELNTKLEHYQNLKNRLLDFELIVTFFIDPTLEYQAMIFATINKTQTKVPENLVFSLFGLTQDDSPQKTSLEIVLALNGIEKSPFYNRIKLVGQDYRKGQIVPLSQATMVKSILYNISNNLREAELDRFKKRSDLLNNPKGLAFRKYYAKNEDRKIIRILYSFFSAVRNSFRDKDGNSYWDLNKDLKVTNVLHTNVGYQALLKVLIDLLKVIPEDKKDDRETYESFLNQVKEIDWDDVGEEKRYPFTSSTINTLYQDIMNEIKLGSIV